MKIKYNCCVPFGDFEAITWFGTILAKYSSKPLTWLTNNHEHIHEKQVIQDFRKSGDKRELTAWFRYYLKYVRLWIKYGYNNNPLEVEAYLHQYDLNYIENRVLKAWEEFNHKN